MFTFNKTGIAYLLVSVALTSSVMAQKADDQSLYFADPTIFGYKNKYYLYGTGGNSDSGFNAMQSGDLKKWLPVNDGQKVLKVGESFGTKGFWAPQVFEHNGKICIAYTANENIAIAYAETAAGPFKQASPGALKAPVKQIDPFVFKDDDGTLYLYHVRLQQGNRIFTARLKNDLSTIEEESLTQCISADINPQDWEDTQKVKWTVTEGPSVLKVGNKYLMLYSANDFRNPDYAVGYATADHPLGPWKKAADNPVISQKITWHKGSGHGDIIKDKKGSYYYVFHTHHSDTKVGPRRTAIIGLTITSSKEGDILVSADAKTFRMLGGEERRSKAVGSRE